MKTKLQKLQLIKNTKKQEKFKQKDPTEQQLPSYRVPAPHITSGFPRVSHFSSNLLTERELKSFFPGPPSCRNNTDLWVCFALRNNNISHEPDKDLKIKGLFTVESALSLSS